MTKVIKARNVNQAYSDAFVLMMQSMDVREQESRAGRVLVSDTPVMTVTERPMERVLTDEVRDANPFFHLFESLWMLAGMDDGRWLDRFVSDFSSRFAERDNGKIWGAYGKRWVSHFDTDQIALNIVRLRHDPTDRRCVIAMWDPQYDLWNPDEIDEDTGRPFSEPRDLPCNTHIYPRIVNGKLDITVCCRSNDIVWGAYGANAVHFSVLQEVMAAKIGVGVGTMYQLSNNWHVYTDIFMKVIDSETRGVCQYVSGQMEPMPMVTLPDRWDEDLRVFMHSDQALVCNYHNTWFRDVAAPMLMAHNMWRSGDRNGAVREVQRTRAGDWRYAATRWMARRGAVLT